MKIRFAVTSLAAFSLMSLAVAQSASINTTRSNIKHNPPKMMADGSVNIDSLVSALPGMIGESIDSVEQLTGRKMVPITLNETLGGERIFAQSGEFKFVMPFTVSGGDGASITVPPQGTGDGWTPWKPITSSVMFKVNDKTVVGVLMILDPGEMNGPGYFTVLNALTEAKQFDPRQVGVDGPRGPMDAMWVGNAVDLIGNKGLAHWGDRKGKPIRGVSGDPHEYLDGRMMFSQGTVNQIPFMVAGLACPMIPVGPDQRTHIPDFFLPIKRVFDAPTLAAGANSVLIPSPSAENVTALLPFGGVIAVGDLNYRITKPGMDRCVRTFGVGRGYFNYFNKQF